MKKKLMALVLAATMVLGMSTTVFAEEQELANYLDKEAVIPKTYVINNGTAPAETFTYEFEGVSYVDGDGNTVENATIPEIEDQTISFDAISKTTEKTTTFAIAPDEYELGVYTYKVTEVTGSTAGVTYSEEELYLVLTILRDEDSDKHYVAAMHYETANGTDKESGFTNEYDAGQLSVTKEITGNMADMNKKFEFTVTFTSAEGTEFDATVQIVNDNATTTREYTQTVDENGVVTITFELGDGETATFTNLPAGTTYTVEENAENYTSDDGVWSDAGKVISANDEDTVTFTNKLTSEVDTGISLDNLPYIMMLAMVCAIAVLFVVNKKRSINE